MIRLGKICFPTLAIVISLILTPASSGQKDLDEKGDSPTVSRGTAKGPITIEGNYCGFYGFPEEFFEGSLVSKEQIVKVLDAQYLSLKELHNGISPYDFARIEYEPSAYGSTLPNGLKVGDSAAPKLNSGHPRWEVMGHEQGHNFFGGTSGFYGTLAFPLPFLQESLAVLSAFYTYHHIIDNLEEFGIDEFTRRSLDFDFRNGRKYQEGQYWHHIKQGKKFDTGDVLTSQALDYQMILYGETYGWENFKKLAKVFQNGMGHRLTFHKDGVSDVEQSTFIIAALGASFGKDFQQEFRELNLPIDERLYREILPKIQEYITQSD